MDLIKYQNDGWGISVLGFTKLLEIIIDKLYTNNPNNG